LVNHPQTQPNFREKEIAMNTFRKGLRYKASLISVLMLLIALLTPGAATAAASTFTVSSIFPIDILVYVPCAAGGAGEEVLLTGNLHEVFTFTFNSAGGVLFSVIDHPQGISGMGSTTGDKYQATGETRFTFTARVGSEQTFVNNFKIIGQGSGNNLLIHETFHVTVNPDGTLTAFVDNFSAECR
jgi:hypothetical protein